MSLTLSVDIFTKTLFLTNKTDLELNNNLCLTIKTIIISNDNSIFSAKITNSNSNFHEIKRIGNFIASIGFIRIKYGIFSDIIYFTFILFYYIILTFSDIHCINRRNRKKNLYQE